MRFFAGTPLVLLCCSVAVGCDEKSQDSAPAPAPTETEATSAPTPAAKKPKRLPQGKGLSPQEVEKKCRSVCDKTSKLPCVETDACVAGCLETFGMPACRGEFGAMLNCTEQTPLTGFACGDTPTPILQDGHCEAEQEKAARCLESLMRAQQAAQP